MECVAGISACATEPEFLLGRCALPAALGVIQMGNSSTQAASLRAILAGTLLSSFGFGMAMPVIPLHATWLGASASVTGLILAAFGAARALVNIPAGLFGEKYGFKPVIIAGGLVWALAGALYALASSLWVLVGLSFVMGVGRGIQWTALLATTGKLSTPQTRGRMMTSFSSADLLGWCPGPFVGGMLADRIGFSAAFWGLALFEVMASAAVALMLKEPRGRDVTSLQDKTEPVFSAVSVLRSRSFVFVAAAQFFCMFGASGVGGTLAPLLGTIQCGMSATQIGTAMTLGAGFMVISIRISGRLFDMNMRRALLIGGPAGCMLAAFLFVGANTVGVFTLATVLVFFAAGFLHALPYAYAASLSTSATMGRVMGILQTAGDIGYLSGPIVVGLMIDASGFTVPLLFYGGMQVLVFGSLALQVEGKRSSNGGLPAHGRPG